MARTPLPDPNLPWPVPLSAVALIAEREGLRLKAYRCPAGVWSIGRGETDGVQPGDTCTVEQADRWMCEDLTDRVKVIRGWLKEPANDNQLGALASLAYNIGLRDDKRKAGLYYSSVLRLHNAGDFAGAQRAFGLYNKARNPKTGQLEVIDGLVTRRAMEAALYVTPDEDEPHQPMPQAVEPESKMKDSPINRNAATVAVTGAGWLASQLDDLQPLVERGKALLVDTLGLPPKALLIGVGAIVVYAGVRIVMTRLQQRREGWA